MRPPVEGEIGTKCEGDCAPVKGERANEVARGIAPPVKGERATKWRGGLHTTTPYAGEA